MVWPFRRREKPNKFWVQHRARDGNDWGSGVEYADLGNAARDAEWRSRDERIACRVIDRDARVLVEFPAGHPRYRMVIANNKVVNVEPVETITGVPAPGGLLDHYETVEPIPTEGMVAAAETARRLGHYDDSVTMVRSDDDIANRRYPDGRSDLEVAMGALPSNPPVSPRVSYMVQNRHQDEDWQDTDLIYDDRHQAINAAEFRSRDAVAWGMCRVLQRLDNIVVVEYAAGHEPYVTSIGRLVGGAHRLEDPQPSYSPACATYESAYQQLANRRRAEQRMFGNWSSDSYDAVMADNEIVTAAGPDLPPIENRAPRNIRLKDAENDESSQEGVVQDS